MRYSTGTLLLLMTVVGALAFAWRERREAARTVLQANAHVSAADVRLIQEKRLARQAKAEFGQWLTTKAEGHARAGRMGEARAGYEDVLTVQEMFLGKDQPETMSTVLALGRLCHRQGDFKAAEALLERFVEYGRAKSQRFQLGLALATLASIRMEQGQFNEALTLYDECHRVRTKQQGNHWWTPATASCLGEAMVRCGRFAEAEPILVGSYDTLKRQARQIPSDERPLQLGRAARRVAELYVELGESELAERWRAKAAQHGQPLAPETSPVEVGAAAHPSPNSTSSDDALE